MSLLKDLEEWLSLEANHINKEMDESKLKAPSQSNIKESMSEFYHTQLRTISVSKLSYKSIGTKRNSALLGPFYYVLNLLQC